MWRSSTALVLGLMMTLQSYAGNFYVTAGTLLTETSSSVSMGMPLLGAKFKMNAEDSLALSEKVTSPYIKFVYELDNAHSFYFDWRSLRRNTSVTGSTKPLSVMDSEYRASASIDLSLDIDIARLGYGYNFFENEKWRFDLLLGLHMMQLKTAGSASINVGFDEKILIDKSKPLASKMTAPMPNFGLNVTYKLLPQVSLTTHLQTFMISTPQLDGALTDFNIGVEYQINDNFAVSAAYTQYEIEVAYGDSLLNARANIEFSGPMVALTYQF